MFKKLEPIFDMIGEIMAVFLVVVWILSLTNAQWGYMDSVPSLVKAIAIMRNYGSVILMFIVGFEAMCKRNIVFFTIFCVCVVFIIIFLFFPATYENIMSLVSKKA